VQVAALQFLKGEYALSNMLRVRFKRGENTKFVSHLDLMENFDRAIRRAGLPLAYSHGFNPHPALVFGLPLSVGITSEAEYMDIEFTEDIEKETFLTRINESLPEGLECLEAEYFDQKSNIMKEITFASYDMLVSFNDNIEADAIKASIESLRNAEKIIVQKEGKNGIKDMDIKPLISEVAYGIPKAMNSSHVLFKGDTGVLKTNGEYALEYLEGVVKSGWKISYDPQKVMLFSILCNAGSRANMKPELFISALGKVLCKDIKVVKIHRTGLYIDKNGEISSPI